MALTRVERDIRWSGIFLLAALLVEAASLLKVAALSFVLYTTVGIFLFAVGAALYLLSLLQAGSEKK